MTTDPRVRLAEIKARLDKLDEVNTADIGLQMSAHYAVDTMLREDLPATAAALTAVLDLHRPVDVEPSETICHGCSTLRGSGENARYFPFEDYPCPTVTRIQEALNGIA